MIGFEVAKLLVQALVPLAVLFIGWRLNKSLKEFEHSQWRNQKLVEKKLALYDDIVPSLNDLFCFYCFVGHWKEIEPQNVVEIKRTLDRKMNVYAGILGNETVGAYSEFMVVAFDTYSSEGGDAKIKTVIESFDGNRRIHSRYQWNQSWDHLFVYPPVFDRMAFEEKYYGVIKAFRRTIGIPGMDLQIPKPQLPPHLAHLIEVGRSERSGSHSLNME